MRGIQYGEGYQAFEKIRDVEVNMEVRWAEENSR
jgi:hypothetical protein